MSAPRELTVLVTGSDAPGFPSIVRALRLSTRYNLRIVATDWKENLKGRRFADAAYTLPDNRSPAFPEELLKVCQREQVDVVLPIRTDDQLPLCRRLGEFEAVGVVPAVVTPDPDLMETAINKLRMLEYLHEVAGLPVPRHRVATTRAGMEEALEDLGYPDVPVVVKPAHASGSRGFRVLDPRVNRRQAFFEEKPSSTHMAKDDLLAVLGKEFPEMLVMEFLGEPEFTLDVLCYKGRTFAVVARRREKMVGGITVNGVVERPSDAMEDYVKRAVEAFGLSFSVGMQFRPSGREEGMFYPLEINPRLQGTTVISVAAGVNVPELMLDMALRTFDFDFQANIRYGLRMERVYWELFEHDGEVFSLEELGTRDA